eukprot:IDg12105t1
MFFAYLEHFANGTALLLAYATAVLLVVVGSITVWGHVSALFKIYSCCFAVDLFFTLRLFRCSGLVEHFTNRRRSEGRVLRRILFGFSGYVAGGGAGGNVDALVFAFTALIGEVIFVVDGFLAFAARAVVLRSVRLRFELKA